MQQDNEIPMFTIVSAVYNVARYLPDFIDSIEAQTRPLSDLEIIMVDDGSTDDSASIIREWQHRRPGLVTLIQRENGGQAAARNDGLDRARGLWVTFTDPDDVLVPEYMDEVSAALQRWPEVAMIATPRIFLRDETGEVVNGHALRRLFGTRSELKNLNQLPGYFHNSAPTAFFRRTVIEEHTLRFDARIRPNFEDGHFVQRYLLRCNQPDVAFVPAARYLYRKRADLSSALQTGSVDPRRFRDVPRHGYLELLQEASQLRGGRPPAWLQSMIIYELSWFISPEDNMSGNATACHGPLAAEFVDLLREIRTFLDEDVIDAFETRPLRSEWYHVLRHGLVDTPWHSEVVLHRFDKANNQVQFSYRWTGTEPQLEVLQRGLVVPPSASKVRSWQYFDHVLMRERVVWAPADATLVVRLNGRPAPMEAEWRSQPRLSLYPATLRRLLGVLPPLGPPPPSRREQIRRLLILRFVNNPLVRRYFSDAWVLLDRVGEANDNAEVLFSHLREHHPEVKAWFVIDRRTSEGKRVRRLFGNRVVNYRSLKWKLLMLNARHVISSHAEVPILDPAEIRALGVTPQWKNTFLQHGVTKNDLSSWLNPKGIDLLVTTTPDEQASIVEDGTRWRFTSKESKMLGMPRLDDLRNREALRVNKPRDLVLISPTWRDWLSKPRRAGEVTRDVVDNLAETEWAENWVGLLNSTELAEACRARGLTLGFLPHPNLQVALKDMTLPPHVNPLSFGDVRTLFTRAAVAVTDYSSVVFDTAVLGRPAVYFQFDEERIKQGGHTGRDGYYDYRRDGYGPVTTTVSEAVEAIVSFLDADGQLQQPYLDRASKDFAHIRDGRCCERVVDAIKSM